MARIIIEKSACGVFEGQLKKIEPSQMKINLNLGESSIFFHNRPIISKIEKKLMK